MRSRVSALAFRRDRVLKRSVTLAAVAAFTFSSSCSQNGGTQVDLIVAGDFVVPMDEDNTIIQDGAVVVDDGMIVAIGPYAELAGQYRASEVLDGKDQVVMPGLINGHTHAAMSLLRGIADDRALMDWLLNYIFPTELRFVDAEFVRLGTELACWEMIRGGTTTFVDMYYFPDSVAEAVESCGLRALVAPSVIDQKAPDAEDLAQGLRNAVDFVQRWRGRNNRIIPVIGAHSVYTIKPEQLAEIRARAVELDVAVAIHVSEARDEIDTTQKNYATTPVHHLNAMDFFDAKTIAAHVVWPTEDELPILAEKSVGTVHNPTSNMKTSSGVSPVPELLAAGVAVGLGTDGPASNNDLDMWEEMRLAALLQKISRMDPKALPAATVLNMATRGGAQALGLDDQIGSLGVGLRADLIQVSLADLHFTPLYDVISHLVYVADEQDVSNVVVDGRIVMRDKKVLTVDEARVRREASELATRIKASLPKEGP